MKNDIGVYNPLSVDFSHKHSEYPEPLIIRSREIAYFPEHIAKFMKKHLYDAIINKRGLNGIELNADIEKKNKILEEMNVHA